MGFVQIHHFQAFCCKAGEPHMKAVYWICRFPLLFWLIFYHVNIIDFTAYPNVKDFSLVWNRIKLLSHRCTITLMFSKYSFKSISLKFKENRRYLSFSQEKRHKEQDFVRMTWNVDNYRVCNVCVHVWGRDKGRRRWGWGSIFLVIYKLFFCPQGTGYICCTKFWAFFSIYIFLEFHKRWTFFFSQHLKRKKKKKQTLWIFVPHFSASHTNNNE